MTTYVRIVCGTCGPQKCDARRAPLRGRTVDVDCPMCGEQLAAELAPTDADWIARRTRLRPADEHELAAWLDTLPTVDDDPDDGPRPAGPLAAAIIGALLCAAVVWLPLALVLYLT